MIYTYYNKESRHGATATSLKSIARVARVQYLDLLQLFKNGSSVYETEEYLILKTKLIKGKQGVKRDSSQGDDPAPVVDKQQDEFDQLLNNES